MLLPALTQYTLFKNRFHPLTLYSKLKNWGLCHVLIFPATVAGSIPISMQTAGF